MMNGFSTQVTEHSPKSLSPGRWAVILTPTYLDDYVNFFANRNTSLLNTLQWLAIENIP